MRLWWSAFSRIFDTIGNIEIGRWFFSLVESPDLKTDVIFAIFQTEGTVYILIDKVIKYVKGPAIYIGTILKQTWWKFVNTCSFLLFWSF